MEDRENRWEEKPYKDKPWYDKKLTIKSFIIVSILISFINSMIGSGISFIINKCNSINTYSSIHDSQEIDNK